jgi:hypothetical protein
MVDGDLRTPLFPDGLATQIAAGRVTRPLLRFPRAKRLGQRLALLGFAEGLARQDKTANQDSE